MRLSDAPAGEVYFSYRQWPTPKLHLLVRAEGDPVRLVPELRRIVQEVDPENAITYIRTLDGVMDEALWQQRLWAYVLALFAALALVLVSVGVYGVVSHSVGQRTRELGIRMALGADPRRVLWMIVGEGLGLVLVGVVIGLAATFPLAHVVSPLLYGVTATDPLTLAAVSGVLGLVAFVACSIPARTHYASIRRSRCDPSESRLSIR